MAAPDKLVDAVVARGRTVLVGDKKVGAGGEVSLPVAEVKHLRAAGFLVVPGEAEIPVGEGPMFGTSDGPSIKVA